MCRYGILASPELKGPTSDLALPPRLRVDQGRRSWGMILVMLELNLNAGGILILYLDQESLRPKGLCSTASSCLRDNWPWSLGMHFGHWALGFTI